MREKEQQINKEERKIRENKTCHCYKALEKPAGAGKEGDAQVF